MEIRMTSEVSLQEAEDMILACGNENAIHLVKLQEYLMLTGLHQQIHVIQPQ